MDWPVSLPVPSTAKLAAMAAPVPPLDPPGVRVRSYGFSVCPPSELTDDPFSASSVWLALPMTMAPASRRRATTNASRGGTERASVTAPPVVGRSAVSTLSLRIRGMPCSGGRAIPATRSRSIPAAASSARGFTVMMARSAGPFLSNAAMRSRHSRTTSTQVVSPDASAACTLATVASTTEKRRPLTAWRTWRRPAAGTC